MKRWEYEAFVVSLRDKESGHSFGENLWRPDDFSGVVGFDALNSYGKKGWELVSVTPLAGEKQSGQTKEVLFTLKRPLED